MLQREKKEKKKTTNQRQQQQQSVVAFTLFRQFTVDIYAIKLLMSIQFFLHPNYYIAPFRLGPWLLFFFSLKKKKCLVFFSFFLWPIRWPLLYFIFIFHFFFALYILTLQEISFRFVIQIIFLIPSFLRTHTSKNLLLEYPRSQIEKKKLYLCFDY